MDDRTYLLLVGKCYEELLTGVYKPSHKDETIADYFREKMLFTDDEHCHFLLHDKFGAQNEGAVWVLFVDWCRSQGFGDKISSYAMEHYDATPDEYVAAFNGGNDVISACVEKFTDYALQAADERLPKERDKLKHALLDGLASLAVCYYERYRKGERIHRERFVCFNRSRSLPLVPSSDLFNASLLSVEARLAMREAAHTAEKKAA